MATITIQNTIQLGQETLDLAFRSLAIRLEQNQAEPTALVVCGGSALILAGFLARTTKDVDIVALMRDGRLIAPDPFPGFLLDAVREVAEDLNLPADWLNNGPSRGDGGLFQMGLPRGFTERLSSLSYGAWLTVFLISRIDQIYFKLYAAADQGGYHITDLLSLRPRQDELLAAARWAMTHDTSEGFAAILGHLLRELGYDETADRM